MKRPISILCMADLHYEKGNMDALDQLCSDYKVFVDKDVKNQRWNPDYIAIAGDIIDWTAQYDSDKYDHAKENVDNLKKRFGIKNGHVVMVPGNHDNMISTDVKIKELDQYKATFDKYCNDERGASVQEFKNTFLPRFNDYADFCKDYMDNVEYFDSSILDKKMQCLAGVKVFEEDSLCFVIVNTEWLYIPKDPFEKHIEAYVAEGLSSHMKLYEKCQLCTPLIKDAYQLIKSKYADYTVITVMHRGFEDLTWKENNASDRLNIDAINYIKSVSDIILTGHDHTIRTEAPTLINNRIQHFRLGSVGRKEPKTREYIRTASIIRFNPIDGEIELLNMEYERNKGEWSFHPHHNIYPMFSKYERIENVYKEGNETFIRARSNYVKDIENSIERYYAYLDNTINCKIINAYDVVNKGLDECYKDSDSCNYIIIYYVCKDIFLHGVEYNEVRDRTRAEIVNFKEKHINDILNNRIIIGEIYVETPIFDVIEKK